MHFAKPLMDKRRWCHWPFLQIFWKGSLGFSGPTETHGEFYWLCSAWYSGSESDPWETCSRIIFSELQGWGQGNYFAHEFSLNIVTSKHLTWHLYSLVLTIFWCPFLITTFLECSTFHILWHANFCLSSMPSWFSLPRLPMPPNVFEKLSFIL